MRKSDPSHGWNLPPRAALDDVVSDDDAAVAPPLLTAAIVVPVCLRSAHDLRRFAALLESLALQSEVQNLSFILVDDASPTGTVADGWWLPPSNATSTQQQQKQRDGGGENMISGPNASKVVDEEEDLLKLVEGIRVALARLEGAAGALCVLRHAENGGAAAARDSGLRAARDAGVDVALMTDVDAEVDADWAAEHVKAQGENPGAHSHRIISPHAWLVPACCSRHQRSRPPPGMKLATNILLLIIATSLCRRRGSTHTAAAQGLCAV